MKKFLKLSVLVFLILLVAVTTALGVSAQTDGTPARYDAFSEGIVSSYYSIDYEKGFITGVAPGTTAERLKNVCLPSADITVSQDTLSTGTTVTATVTVVIEPEPQPTESSTVPSTDPTTDTTVSPSDSADQTTDTTVSPSDSADPATDIAVSPSDPTASTEDTDVQPQALSLDSRTETKTFSLTVIVTGDLNGDGAVTITDMLQIKSAVLGETLSETAAIAGDVSYDGKVTITDFLQVKAYLLKISKISAGKEAGSMTKDPLILMTPSSTAVWSDGCAVPGVAAFACDEGVVVSIDAGGTITSGGAEGSAFVYALDANGTVLSRAMVTVLNEKLSVSIGAASHKLIRGETLSLSASFNHPVTPAVTWSSSDTNVVRVDGSGNVTTPGNGTAVVTATLENGSKAETTITVVPPITSVQIERTLYKVKPGASRTLGVLLQPADTGEELVWSSSNPAIATVSNDGTVTGVAYGTVTITAKGKYSGLTATCKVKVCDVKQVAITFDDGPSGYTNTLLDFLKENDIRITFFLVGNRINRYPNTVKRQVAEGHEIGYHSYAHDMQTSLSSSKITSDFNASNKTLKSLTGAEFTVWRAPGGDYSERVLKCIELPHIMWSVDTRDWEVLNTDAVYRAVRNAKDGDIVLLHDLYSSSVNGAIRAMREMNAGDYEFVTVTELLSRKGTAPKKCTTYYSGR